VGPSEAITSSAETAEGAAGRGYTSGKFPVEVISTSSNGENKGRSLLANQLEP